ncbi:hypothetical protein WPS_00180 [Vulcanimicrobium alpinum]|uniref:LPS export ABC transporter periplasmic protein LptC n=1 Tax=Vulcanimicrobium alpinum TaxID=3016050 RepID=A0AAN1XRM6_UNVUL|nr:LPS export ABC transporter periplasmic protein LptC [Vulcanimicrobium alpinum]BDE04742.1 hypothetical protein WPS_00180 [Vulcanimicrobium alpinum]
MPAKPLCTLLLLAVAAGCAPKAPAPAPGGGSPAPTATATPVPVHVVGAGKPGQPAVLSETKANRKIYTIRAVQFEGDALGTNGVGRLDHPHITFYDKTGSVTVADAPKATVKQRDKSIDMTGGVHARTAEGGVLTCDSLRYDAGTERLLGTGHVVLTSPDGLRLSGDRLDGDVRLHDARVTSGSAA